MAAEEILGRLDNIELAIPAGEISYLPTLAIQAVERLPLRFSALGGKVSKK